MSSTFSYGIKNLTSTVKEFTLDCSASVNVLFSEGDGRVTKLVPPGELVFFLNVEAKEGEDEFGLADEITFTQA